MAQDRRCWMAAQRGKEKVRNKNRSSLIILYDQAGAYAENGFPHPTRNFKEKSRHYLLFQVNNYAKIIVS
jgi:hypothetical protein